ncbi:MAG: protein translocase subunit SecF [Spirochaetales bacterium]|nr:MAG: protein translocase subunit SecF [Spirochaetales bacterium]
MTRLIRFHKAFLPAAIISLVVIAFGVVGIFVKGFNLGVDFQAGINQYIQLAYPAATITYNGGGTPKLTISESVATVVFTGVDATSRTVLWDLSTVGTIADLAGMMKAEGLEFTIIDGAGLSADFLVPTYQGDYILSPEPVLIHRSAKNNAETFGTIEEIRAAVASIGSASVQDIGAKGSMQYVIRVRDDGSDTAFSANVPLLIEKALNNAFGSDRTVAMKTDYVGARFSKDLADNSWKLILFTLTVILIYAGIRFKFQFAAGAVLAIIHDALIVVGFIVWSGMEFNTSSIAAILTILGYSINDTIVIFDRIREDRTLNPTDKLTTIIDKSITETLGRTFITIITTLLAVFALYIFTSGSIKDFSLALIVGMISGTYSTVFVASGFVSFWEKHMAHRFNRNASTAVTAKTVR